MLYLVLNDPRCKVLNWENQTLGPCPALFRRMSPELGFPVAQLVKNPPPMQETLVRFWVGKICWRRDRLPTPVFLGFRCGSAGKESACNTGDLSSIPGLGRSPGEGNGHPLQYSGRENYMDWATNTLHSECCLFTLFIVCFPVQKLLSLIRFHLFIYLYLFPWF